MLISLVGLSGSGKGFIAKMLTEYSNKIVHLDIDRIGHKSHQDEQVKQSLVETFGPEILKDNEINRRALASIVFSSPDQMHKLEDITWSFMEKEIDEFIETHPNQIIILDWLLLPKTKYFKASDLRILITASQETRLNRVISRDGITAEKFFERESAAPPLNEDEFDHIIINEDITKTKEEVSLIYDKSIIHRKF